MTDEKLLLFDRGSVYSFRRCNFELSMASSRVDRLRDKLGDEVPRHADVESPDLLAGGDDLWGAGSMYVVGRNVSSQLYRVVHMVRE